MIDVLGIALDELFSFPQRFHFSFLICQSTLIGSLQQFPDGIHLELI